MNLQITLLAAAIAALIGIWLAARCGSARRSADVAHGDGGDPALMRRMRAQANFGEYSPLALVLIAALDLAGQGGWALGLSALAFMLGRVLHALGMDNPAVGKLRVAGMILTLPIMFGLAIAAILTAFGVI